MAKKCKICGYRFKSADEAICPECFTARDDDISCEQYSASEHSHRKSVSSGFGDSGESFVQSELREERRNQFANENFGERAGSRLNTQQPYRHDASRFARSDYNSPPPQAKQPSAYEKYIAQVQRKQGGTGSQSGFTAAGQRIAQQSTFSPPPSVAHSSINNTPRSTLPAKKKQSSIGAVLFLLIFIMGFASIISVATSNTMNDDWDNTTDVQETTVVTARLNSSASSDKNIYNAQADIVAVEDIDASEIPDYLKNNLQDYTGQNDSWKMVTIDVRITQGEAFTTEQAEPTLVAAYLYGFENPDMRKQISSSSVSVREKIDVPSGGRDMTVRLLVHKDASYANFNFTLSCKINGSNKYEACRFNLELPE